MRIVCQQTILMKYHALFVIFENEAKQNLLLSSAANYRWRFAIHNNCCLLSHLLMYFDSQYCKQYGPRSDCSTGKNMIKEHIGSLNRLVMDRRVASSRLNRGTRF